VESIAKQGPARRAGWPAARASSPKPCPVPAPPNCHASSTAIYQVEILADGRGEIGEFFIRFQDPASGRFVERSWPIPYQANAPAADQAAPSMQLATLAMLTAEQLRGSPLAAAITSETTRPLVDTITTHFRDNPRARELLEIHSHLAHPLRDNR